MHTGLLRSRSTARLERQRLLALINSMTDGVIAVDEAGQIVLYNGAALNVLDINSLQSGMMLANVLKPIDKDNQPVDIAALIRQTKTPLINRDYRLAYSDKSFISLYMAISPVHLGYGERGQRGFVLQLRDITREKLLEEERDEFISVVSHELRTPIAIVEGNISNAEFITGKNGNLAEVKEALAAAHKQIDFLAGLVNDLSTLSRAERGKLTVDVTAINAHDLVNELAKNYTPEAGAKNLQIETEVDPKLELLNSSELYVREILQNLITNAIKYTEKGRIIIGAKQGVGGVDFSVADTGIGISKGDQARIFSKFFRSEDYRTQQTRGTGLGLYVTAKLVNLIHAQIRLNSQLDRGSVFSVFVPNLSTK